MSVIRGFFQGFNNLKPYAISQISEQVIRVIWMLLTAYFIMKIGSGDYVEAVTQSTFAAFVGMLASMLVLLFYLAKTGMLRSILRKPKKSAGISGRSLLWDTIREAIPFIITGSAIQLFQIIDQATFINIMTQISDYTKSELLVQFAYFSANPNKITMILIAVATSIGGVGIPLLTENYVKGDFRSAARLVQDNLSMLLFFIFPSTVGAVMVASPLYTVFYGKPDSLALGLFICAMLQTIILSTYTVLAPMIQALFQNKKAILYFFYGVLVKLSLQVPMINLFHAYGPLISTTVGLLLPIFFMFREIRKVVGLNPKNLLKRLLLSMILTIAMVILVLLVEYLLSFIFQPTNRMYSFIYVAAVGGVGMLVYIVLSLKVRLIDRFIGQKADSLRQRLRMK
jgi:polysaccharide biosynthesis protein, putative